MHSPQQAEKPTRHSSMSVNNQLLISGRAATPMRASASGRDAMGTSLSLFVLGVVEQEGFSGWAIKAGVQIFEFAGNRPG
jgi:hypothetical protein